MNFIALDFETANYDRSSACAIGIVKVRGSTITDTMFSLIMPPTNYFLPRFVDIHGIDLSMVQKAPSFRELWPKIQAFIGKDKIAAHNYSFDKGVLETTLEYYSLKIPLNTWICSLQISRQTWPALDGHSLDIVADSLGIPLKHHDALEDAKACALICLAAANRTNK
jgi:DNA polymerase-3 subunit epsilon